MTKRLIQSVLVLSVLSPSAVSAQTELSLPDDALPDPFLETPDEAIQLPTTDAPPVRLPTITPSPIPSESISAEATIVVSDFIFDGNTVISSQELSAIAAAYTGRDVTSLALRALEDEITALYVEKGYVTSFAYVSTLGNQGFDPAAAALTVKVVEGQLEEIKVSGAPRLERYVTNRLKQATSPALNQADLEESLRLLQLDPLIQSISVNLVEGNLGPSSILLVDVVAAPTTSLLIGVNNGNSPLSGRFEQGGRMRLSNLTGLGETVSAGYYRSEGSDQYDLDLSIPVNVRDGRVGFEFAEFDSQIIEAPFDVFDIRSQNRSYRAGYQQPVVSRADDSSVEELALGLSVARLESDFTVEGFLVSPNAEDSPRTRVNEISFSQEYLQQTRGSVVVALSSLSVGSDTEQSSEYLRWNGQAAWLRRFGKNSFSLQGRAQFSANELPPIVQFSLGSLRATQGFRQRSLLSDNGVTTTAELQLPFVEAPVRLSAIPFFETGVGWDNGSSGDRTDFFVAPGIGLQLDFANFGARVDYALPLTDVDETGDSRIGFQLQYRTAF